MASTMRSASFRQFRPAISICSGRVSLDARPVALLDPPADPNATIFKPFRLYAGGGEHPLIALQNGHRESLRPLSPEIHVYRASALADRPHLAFRQYEMAAFGHKLGPALGRDDDIIRFAPQAKLGLASGPFPRQKLVGARPFPDMGGNPGESSRQHLMRHRFGQGSPADINEGSRPPVAVGGHVVLTQFDILACDDRFQRRACRQRQPWPGCRLRPARGGAEPRCRRGESRARRRG